MRKNSPARALFLAMLFSLMTFVSPVFSASLWGTQSGSWACQEAQGQWKCRETNRSSQLYVSDKEAQAARLQQALGWVPAAGESKASVSCSLCGGHYVEPTFPEDGKITPLDQSAAIGTYRQATYQVNGSVVLKGPLEINQPSRTLYVEDQATLHPDPKTGKLQSFSADGDVRIHQPGLVILGNHASADLFSHRARAQEVTYLTKVRPNWQKAAFVDQSFTGYAHGQASVVSQLNQNVFELFNTTYTTCPPGKRTWQLASEHITLNKEKDQGVATNTVLTVHRIPVLYLPYFSFPLSDARKTGFLYGNIGNSTSNGVSTSFPFYLNLASNLDDTLTPTIYSKRGLLIGNQFRYLFPSLQGELFTEWMPRDAQYDSSNRWKLATTDSGSLSPNWDTKLEYNYVSDPNFIADLEGGGNAITANQVLLNREFSLNYHDSYWQVSGLLQGYQVINDSLLLDNQPYQRLPEIDLAFQYPYRENFPDMSVTSQLVNFQKSNAAFETPTSGQRINLVPTVSWPLSNSYAFLTPKVSLSETSYYLNKLGTGYTSRAVDRAVPIVTLDSGIYLEKRVNWFHQTDTNTIAPRLFYLYVPYRNQNSIPIFDSSISNFTYDSLFSTNRFSGLDRQGDANQLSYALTSKLSSSDGQTLFTGGVGQILYFKNREVLFCQENESNPSCASLRSSSDNVQDSSPYAAYGNISLGNHWFLNNQITYSARTNIFDYQSYQIQYKPDVHRVFNLGYQNNHHDYALMSTQEMLRGQNPYVLSQLTTSFYWNLTPVWSALGQFNYAFNVDKIVQEFVGFEYNSCCIAIRFVVQHYINNTDPNNPALLNGQYDTAEMIQFQFKGLGGTSEQQISALERQIPGHDTRESEFN